MSQLKTKSILSYEEENEDNNSSVNSVIKDNREPNNDKNADKKRSLSTTDSSEYVAKKLKSVDELSQKELPENEPEPTESEELPKPQATISFVDLMQCRIITKKLKRSDLEAIFAHQVSEALMLKDSSAQLHLQIKKQEENLADLQKSLKEQKIQCKNLGIIHKKLLNEIQTQKDTGVQEPLVPLVITRTVGIQVDLSSGNEANESKSPFAGQIGQNVGQQPAPNE